jgi:SNF2 family DNA or RNA helicase
MLRLSPAGRLIVEKNKDDQLFLRFAESHESGIVALGMQLDFSRDPSVRFWQDFSRKFLTSACYHARTDQSASPVPTPSDAELQDIVDQAPPFDGYEYLSPTLLSYLWSSLDSYFVRLIVRSEIPNFLAKQNSAWQSVGRVALHLAENKNDADYPFAFLATYVSRLNDAGRPQHVALGRAVHEYAGVKYKSALLALLKPIQEAAQHSSLLKSLADSGKIFQPQRWTPREAHQFLKDASVFESHGITVRLPNWWKPSQTPRVRVSVTVGEQKQGILGLHALLSFSLKLSINGDELDPQSLEDILSGNTGLVRVKGQWVEADSEKINEALAHWKNIAKTVAREGIPYAQAMRLLAHAGIDKVESARQNLDIEQWTELRAGRWLESVLGELTRPLAKGDFAPPQLLQATLRPYQLEGVAWLDFIVRLGMGACLADDMGLGKTIQVLAMLLLQKQRGGSKFPSILVVPASLIANWQAEAQRFAPSLNLFVVHPAECDQEEWLSLLTQSHIQTSSDLVVTTYGLLHRLPWVEKQQWHIAILDEAQAIKNPATQQSRAARKIQASSRIVLTGTPIENSLGDLWSIFDFICPGLLETSTVFGKYIKNLNRSPQPNYGPLRRLLRPYVLRRLKLDKKIITDLPDKTEVTAYCSLTPRQVALYEHGLQELAQKLDLAEGMARRGLILSYLLRFKQICNHPSQWLGDDDYQSKHSGKFARLTELAEGISSRHEKLLVFTQFREMTEPLAAHLSEIFKQRGLILSGETAVKKRQNMVELFQDESGPPFFVLSLKAGGTGLNLTAASHVIHFDRWWNPAVENQATDRAFRIGQKRNVMVHKFVCRGTIEERIDRMIQEKVAVAGDILGENGAEKLLTEMTNEELLNLLKLDMSAINTAEEN